MPYVRSDDAPRRLRAVWLGPKGARWYWTWTYVQWAATALAVVIAAAFFSGLVWLLSGDPLVAVIIGPLWGAALGVMIIKQLMRHVDHDRPVRFWRTTFRGEWAGSERVAALERGAGWWMSTRAPRTMSRYALAYLGLSTTRPVKKMLPAPLALRRIVVQVREPHAWAVPAADVPRAWLLAPLELVGR